MQHVGLPEGRRWRVWEKVLSGSMIPQRRAWERKKDMKLTIQRWFDVAFWLGACAAWTLTNAAADTLVFSTTTVQGTVYLADGRPGSGTLQLSWPAFTTASNQAVAAGRTNVTIGADGYVSVNLAPNQGSTPAGLYYTAVYHLSDGTTSTEYWTVPAAAQASLSQVRAQVMPAAQAVQAVSKSYVDQSIAELTESLLTASGGSLTGPLFLNGDPTEPAQAATKRYVDKEFGMAVPLTGAAMSGPLTSVQLGAAYQVDQFPGEDFGARLQACLNGLDATYGGTCDARNFTGSQTMGSAVVIQTANASVQLPCATISTANPIQITAGTRNVTLRGCALRGASNGSGSQGGTVFLYSGNGPMIEVGDSTYAADTPGFHLDDVVINTTASSNAGAQGLAAYRTQEIDLESLYLLGNSSQTGMTLDGTGNYTGGTFQDIELVGFGTALNGVGHQITNAAATDWLNASTFIRLHIDCPTSGGNPVAGTYGINLLQGDGNTFTGGDVEGCATALHLGPNAQNNTIVGLRNENSNNQVVADAGSAYNSWITGGTMFTGQLADNGTRNSFLDTFHRSFNSLNGDWYGSQQDATVTNHFRIGTGAGNERGLLNRYQSDYGYRWTTGLSDATAGEQFYQVQDELNNVYRLSIGQYNHGQSSTNNQTVINAAGTGAVVLNGSANSGTGGVIFGSGGSTGATVATINNAGNAQFNGTLQVSGPSTFIGTTTVKNQSDAEIDSVLWAGAAANQKESFIYKDNAGASQWYMVKDASNNWALNSATGGLDSIKAYQSNNSGDTYINASNGAGHIRLNYETGSGSETDIYSGSSSALVAAFLGSTAIKFPGLASAGGRNCIQIDNSGYISNTGAACGGGTVNAGTTGQVAFYAGSGTALSGMTSVAVNSGGTGATTAAQALQNLGAQPAMAGVASDGASGMTVGGNVAAAAVVQSAAPTLDARNATFAGGCPANNSTDCGTAIQAAMNALPSGGGEILLTCGSTNTTYCYWANPSTLVWPSKTITFKIQGTLRIGTTLATSNNGSLFNIDCLSGGGPANFQAGHVCTILEKGNTANNGTLGTAVNTTIGTGATVTFTPSTMSGLYPGVYITVGGNQSCTGGSLARSSNVVTATFSAACHIPPGLTNGITVAGMSDSSYNGTFTASASDYTLNTITWPQTGSNGTTSGGTVTGFNEDTPETIPVTATTGTTATATFYRPHLATDTWGVVGLALLNTGSINDVSFSSNDGTVLYVGPGNFFLSLNRIGSTCGSININYCLEADQSSFVSIRDSTFSAGPQSPWGLWMTATKNVGGSGTGNFYLDHSAISTGVKMDHGAMGLYAVNTFIEHGARGNVVVDPTYLWNGFNSPGTIALTNVGTNDTSVVPNTCAVYYTNTPGPGKGQGTVFLYQQSSSNQNCLINDYFKGNFKADAPQRMSLITPKGVRGVFDDGLNFEGPIRGMQASFGPAMIPFATANVTTNPASWSGMGTCTVTTGVLDPFWNAGASSVAGQLTTGSSSCGTNVGSWTGTAAAGDQFFYGGWTYSSTPGTNVVAGNQGSAFTIGPTGAVRLDGSNASNSSLFDSNITDDWWHPVVATATVTTGGSTTVTLSMGSDPNHAMNFACPFLAYVPATSNIPLREIYRVAAQLLRGCVPSNYNGLGIPATTKPIATSGYYLLNPSGGAPNQIIPSYITSFQGNSSATALPFSIPWSTPSSVAAVCHDANGNITDNGCTSGGNVTSPGAGFTVGNLIKSTNTGGTGIADAGLAVGAITQTGTPAWLQFVGNGADGANTNAAGNISASELYYTNFTVPFGNTFNITGGSTIHVTGTATIAGTIVTTSDGGTSSPAICGGSGGGSGGGSVAGTAGTNTAWGWASVAPLAGGSAGASGGGNGGNGQAQNLPRACMNSGGGMDGVGFSGGQGKPGGSSGGTRGVAGNCVTIIANQIVGTDGTHVGIINMSGGVGTPASANSTGSGSGGGAGCVILASLQAVTSWPTIFTEPGPGALSNGVAQPTAYWVNDSCLTPPKVSLTTSGGALTACTVQSAGAQCGGLGSFTQLGTGGGSGGTITPIWQTATPTGTWASGSLSITVSSSTGITVGMKVVGTNIPPNAYVTAVSGTTVTLNNYTTGSGSGTSLTFTGGALQSCTSSGGSGYQANVTFTTSGNGGDGGPGWYAEFAAGKQVH